SSSGVPSWALRTGEVTSLATRYHRRTSPMWSHGSRRSGRTSSWEDSNYRDRRTDATGVPGAARDRFQRDSRHAAVRTDSALHPLAHHARAPAGIRVVALARL